MRETSELAEISVIAGLRVDISKESSEQVKDRKINIVLSIKAAFRKWAQGQIQYEQ